MQHMYIQSYICSFEKYINKDIANVSEHLNGVVEDIFSGVLPPDPLFGQNRSTICFPHQPPLESTQI